jgi:hypothetical protein
MSNNDIKAYSITTPIFAHHSKQNKYEIRIFFFVGLKSADATQMKNDQIMIEDANTQS